MQVVKPIDIEDALRIDLAALLDGLRVFAVPIPPDLRAGDVVIESFGPYRISGASHGYDVTIGCYATDEADAMANADEIAGYVASLPLRATATQYSNANIMNGPYHDYDPRAPHLARCSIRASLVCPGEKLKL